MKSLFWKEWRENWVILIMAIGVICLLSYLLEINREFNLGINDIKYVFLFIPLFIAVITANLFSTEFGHNTMPFLLTQPISRSKLWLIKVGFGIFMVLLLVFGSVLGVYLVSQITPHSIQLNELKEITAYQDVNTILVLCLLFASGIFMATMVTNTYIAAFGSIAFAVMTAAFWSSICMLFYLDGHWYSSFWIVIGAILFSSYYSFTRPDILIAKKRIRRGLNFFSLIILIYSIIAILVQSNYDDFFIKTNTISRIYSEKIIPTRNLVFAQVYKRYDQDDAGISRLCIIPLNRNNKYTYLSRGYEYKGTGSISPDSRYIVLHYTRRFFGLIKCRLFSSKIYLLDLSTMKINRLPLKGEGLFNEITNLFWSSDGKKVIYMVMSPITRGYSYRIYDFNTQEDKEFHFAGGTQFFYASEFCWTKDNKSLYTWSFLNYDQEREQGINRISQLDLNGKILWENVQYQTYIHPLISLDGNWMLYSQDTQDQSLLRKAYLKNLNTGKSTYILSSPRIKSGFWSPDSKWIAISTISATSESSIWLVNLTMLEKRLLFSERAGAIHFQDWSSDSRRIIVEFWPYSKEKGQDRVYDIYTNKMQEYPYHNGTYFINATYPDGAFLINDEKNLYLASMDGKLKQRIFP